MSDLHEHHCKACEAGIPPLDETKIKAYLKQCPEWNVSPNKKSITRRFTFKGFTKTIEFVNKVADIAKAEGHHPDMNVGYNYCEIHYTTHAIDGLSDNDFICAAKINQLL
ncbi:MAG TPA: 4a-hydroxytetrahydrobiopterin dehydratase [Coxiellaceae bacterium]|nr:4a-hydroxytetrahydrobiopterin dehydratase [Coxiellaceae bacterium]